MATNRTQAELAAFAVDGDPLEGVELPERGVEWREECSNTPGKLMVVSYDGEFEYPDGNLGANVAGFVVGDVDEYLAEHGEKEVEIPSTYTQFDEFEPIVTKVTCSMSGYGWGITHERMEGIVRFATGGGRYSVDDLRATLCEDGRLVVRAPAGTFVVAPTTIRGKPEGFEPENRTVAGMDVPEHKETILDGIERVVEELDKHGGMDVSEHVERKGSSHKFQTASGTTFSVSANTLGSIGKAHPESEILDTHEYETLWGEEFEYAPDGEELPTRVGEERSFNDSVCIGHRVKWEDPRIGSRLGTNQPLYFKVKSFYLPIPGDGDRVRMWDKTHRIAEFETEGDGTEQPKKYQ